MPLTRFRPMSAPESERPRHLPSRWEDLTPLGRLVVTVGAVGRVTATVLERGVDRAAQIVADSQRAFREGRDAVVDDATVVREDRHER